MESAATRYLKAKNSILSRPILEELQHNITNYIYKYDGSLNILTQVIGDSLNCIMEDLFDVINYCVVEQSVSELQQIMTIYSFWIKLFMNGDYDQFQQSFISFINDQIMSAVSTRAIENNFQMKESVLPTLEILQKWGADLSYHHYQALKFLLYGLMNDEQFNIKQEVIEYMIQYLFQSVNDKNNYYDIIQKTLECRDSTHPLLCVASQFHIDFCTSHSIQLINRQRKRNSIKLKSLLMNMTILYGDCCGVIADFIWSCYIFDFDPDKYDNFGNYI